MLLLTYHSARKNVKISVMKISFWADYRLGPHLLVIIKDLQWITA